ncbi:DUF7856 family protein [Halorussus litoreus]|uniref:DUF7856 family protein n=1 Tax=Halorussus litoreus TaxID=1710536 RepID=UPI000E273C5F|nr:hypothetical protein [Halorussus litoreus]
MRVRVRDADRGEVVREGRAVDLRALDGDFDLSPRAVARVVRGESPDPGPVHDHVGVITATVSVSPRAALAAGARSRGHAAPQAEELAAVRERLAELDPPAVDLRRARERVADASDAEAEWRERVATLQGRVQALREVEDDSEDVEADYGETKVDLESAEADLAEATRRLSEVETERIAAKQALARARERAREHRETRRERLRLEDRAGNLRRAARDHLAERVSEDFEAARDAVPEGDFSEDVRTALAVARVAELDAPVVVARGADPFEMPAAAVRWLDAPVLRV